MDCRVWQNAHRLYFLWPWRRASSSDDGPANEPSAEILGCRGGARSQEVRQGIFTTDEGSPHLEWHRRFGDGPDALGAREDRVYVEISTYCQKVRPNRNFSRLRYLTLLADIKERWHIDDRLCVRQSRFASCRRPAEDAVPLRTLSLPAISEKQGDFCKMQGAVRR